MASDQSTAKALIGHLWQERVPVGELCGQIFFDDIVEPPHGERLLFGAHAHLEQLLDRFLPRHLGLEEWIVFKRVFGALDVDLLERMGGELVVDDVLWRHTEKARVWDTEKLRQMGGVARAHLEGSVDIRNPVRITIDKCVHRDLAIVGQLPNETSRRARGNPGQRNQYAVIGFPELVALQPLKHTTGFNCKNKLGLGFERKLFDR